MLRGVDDLDFFIGDEAVDKPTYATKVGSGDSRPGEWLGGGGGRRSVEGSLPGSGGRGRFPRAGREACCRRWKWCFRGGGSREVTEPRAQGGAPGRCGEPPAGSLDTSRAPT